MILVLKPDCTEEQRKHLLEELTNMGFKYDLSEGARRTLGGRHRGRRQAPRSALEGHSGRRRRQIGPQAVQTGQPRVPEGRFRLRSRSRRQSRWRQSADDRRTVCDRERRTARRDRDFRQGGRRQLPSWRGLQTTHQPVQLSRPRVSKGCRFCSVFGDAQQMPTVTEVMDPRQVESSTNTPT